MRFFLIHILLLALALLPGCLNPKPGDAGNGAGYGLIRELNVTKNETLEFYGAEDKSEISRLTILTSPTHGRVENKSTQTLAYTPEINYVGFDEFTYSYVQDGREVIIRAMVDVSPCQRPAAKEFPEADNVHVISVSNALGPNGPNTAKVIVKRTEKPILVVVTSRSSMQWDFELEEGAKVEKVIHYTAREKWKKGSLITGLPPDTKIEFAYQEHWSIGWESKYNLHGAHQFKRQIAMIRSKIGVKETTFQGCSVGFEFQIPYTFESVQKACIQSAKVPPQVADVEGSSALMVAPKVAASHYDFRRQNCADKCLNQAPIGTSILMQASKIPSMRISTNPPTLEYRGAGGNATGFARGSIGRRCGRFYYEITVKRSGFGTSYVGLAGDELVGPSRFVRLTDLGKSQVIGIAVDLDEGFYTFHRDGVYNEKISGFAQTGKIPDELRQGLTTYEQVFPYFEIFKLDSVIVNFGADLENFPFAYPPPPGFAPGY